MKPTVHPVTRAANLIQHALLAAPPFAALIAYIAYLSGALS